MRGAVPPLPQYAFMAWCLAKHRDSFTFYLSKEISKYFKLTALESKRLHIRKDAVFCTA
jgi:hypothetical protein